ncbi:hypothetical protein M404DRAFT_160225, partial [Pisolithus tinctorius Marx 270]
GTTPLAAKVWKSIRNKDVPRNLCNFLWKSLHGCYKIGEYRLKIPLYEMRGTCLLHSETKSLPHILTECINIHVHVTKHLWCVTVECLWLMHGSHWPTINFGMILNAGLADFHHNTWLFTILVLESAHLIWKLHCDWVINKGMAESIQTHDEIHNKWVHTINLRLKFNHLQMDAKHYGNRAIKQETVLIGSQGF